MSLMYSRSAELFSLFLLIVLIYLQIDGMIQLVKHRLNVLIVSIKILLHF